MKLPLLVCVLAVSAAVAADGPAAKPAPVGDAKPAATNVADGAKAAEAKPEEADDEAADEDGETKNAEPSRKFERYQTIIDRMPFGQPPPGFDPLTPGAASAGGANGAGAGAMTAEQMSEEEKKLAASVRMSVLNVTPAGKPMVGFTDSTDAKSPRHYYLEKGAVRDGWTVKDIVPEDRSAVLSRDGIEVTLKLGEATTGGNNAKGSSAPQAHPPAPRMGGRPGLPAAATDAAPPAPALGGLAGLRAKRAQLAAQNKAKEAERAAAAEAARKEREEEKARAAEERAQQREALMQIQEELRRAREEKAKEKSDEQPSDGE